MDVFTNMTEHSLVIPPSVLPIAPAIKEDMETKDLKGSKLLVVSAADEQDPEVKEGQEGRDTPKQQKEGHVLETFFEAICL